MEVDAGRRCHGKMAEKGGHIVSPSSGRYVVSDNLPDVFRYQHPTNASLPAVPVVADGGT